MSEFNPTQQEALMVVISGPSGVGKDAVLQELKRRQKALKFVVTATTRPPRPGEVEGVDYFFVSEDRFQQMVAQGEMLEHAYVYNDYKGVPKAQIRQALASGEDIVMRVDVQGASTIRSLCPEALLVFLTIESEDEIIQRLVNRSTETEESLNLRLAMVREEVKRAVEFDYIIPNRQDCLEETVDTLLAILCAEHHRVPHRRVTL